MLSCSKKESLPTQRYSKQKNTPKMFSASLYLRKFTQKSPIQHFQVNLYKFHMPLSLKQKMAYDGCDMA